MERINLHLISGSGKDELSVEIPFKLKSIINFSFTVQVSSIAKEAVNDLDQTILYERN